MFFQTNCRNEYVEGNSIVCNKKKIKRLSENEQYKKNRIRVNTQEQFRKINTHSASVDVKKQAHNSTH